MRGEATFIFCARTFRGDKMVPTARLLAHGVTNGSHGLPEDQEDIVMYPEA